MTHGDCQNVVYNQSDTKKACGLNCQINTSYQINSGQNSVDVFCEKLATAISNLPNAYKYGKINIKNYEKTPNTFFVYACYHNDCISNKIGVYRVKLADNIQATIQYNFDNCESPADTTISNEDIDRGAKYVLKICDLYGFIDYLNSSIFDGLKKICNHSNDAHGDDEGNHINDKNNFKTDSTENNSNANCTDEQKNIFDDFNEKSRLSFFTTEILSMNIKVDTPQAIDTNLNSDSKTQQQSQQKEQNIDLRINFNFNKSANNEEFIKMDLKNRIIDDICSKYKLLYH